MGWKYQIEKKQVTSQSKDGEPKRSSFLQAQQELYVLAEVA